MLHIENKIEQFLTDKGVSTSGLSKDDSVALSIRNIKFLKGVAFEKNINFQSQIITPPKLFNKVFIGEHSYMNDGGYIRSDVFIGRFCSIGRRVSIGAGQHNISGLSSSPLLNNGGREYSHTEKETLGFKHKLSKKQ